MISNAQKMTEGQAPAAMEEGQIESLCNAVVRIWSMFPRIHAMDLELGIDEGTKNISVKVNALSAVPPMVQVFWFLKNQTVCFTELSKKHEKPRQLNILAVELARAALVMRMLLPENGWRFVGTGILGGSLEKNAVQLEIGSNGWIFGLTGLLQFKTPPASLMVDGLQFEILDLPAASI